MAVVVDRWENLCISKFLSDQANIWCDHYLIKYINTWDLIQYQLQCCCCLRHLSKSKGVNACDMFSWQLLYTQVNVGFCPHARSQVMSFKFHVKLCKITACIKTVMHHLFVLGSVLLTEDCYVYFPILACECLLFLFSEYMYCVNYSCVSLWNVNSVCCCDYC